jgi:hypothetical protein
MCIFKLNDHTTYQPFTARLEFSHSSLRPADCAQAAKEEQADAGEKIKMAANSSHAAIFYEADSLNVKNVWISSHN